MSKRGSSGSSSPKYDDNVIAAFERPQSHIFEPIPPEDQVELEFNDLSAYVVPQFGPNAQNKSWNPFKTTPTGQLKPILSRVHGRASPGEFLALMGPSGSGKSTLLEILGGRSSRSVKCKGRVLFNGSKPNKRLKSKVAFVAQDDLLHTCLTVYETLYYVAMLRLPRSWSIEDKVERVERVLHVLRLDKARHTIIGGAGKRGISGGERKRTSVGSELLINPTLMMLDEPTSGLDSTIALQLTQILRELASGGRSIITSIHQPSSRLLYMFDTLLCLSGGRTLYYGRAADSHAYFTTLGFTVDIGISMSDYVLDLASGQVADDKRSGPEVTAYLLETSEKYQRISEQEGFDASDVETLIEASKCEEVSEERQTSRNPSMFRRHSSIAGGRGSRDEDRIGWWQQVLILTKRSIKTRRHDVVTAQDFLQFVVIALLSGCLWYQIGDTQTVVAAKEISGLLYFIQMFLSFRILFTSLLIFPSEMSHLRKERKSDLYRLSAFVVARAASDIPSDLSLPSLLLIISYWMAALNPAAGAFFATWGVVLLMLLVSQSLGLLIGACVQSVKTAQALAASLMLMFILVGGYFVQATIPGWIGWIKWLSFLHYSYPLLVHFQFSGGENVYACYDDIDGRSCQAVDVENPNNSSLCQPTDLWTELGISGVPPVVNGMVLLGFLVVLRVSVYVALLWKTRT